MQINAGEKPTRGNNLHICIYGCEIKKEMSSIAHCVYILKNVLDQCLSCMQFPKVYLWNTLTNFTQFLQHVGHIWLLFTSKNAVKQCSVIKVTKAPLCIRGFNCTHLIMLTISVITTGQLNVNSWLSMSLRFIGIEYDFVSKRQWI